MKRLHDLLLTIVGMMIVLASCQKAPELTLTGPASLEISADGGSGSITFTANREWSVRSSDSWLSVTPSSGSASDGTVTLSIRCFENTTYEDRTATVTITMEELSQTVTVKQPANLGIVIPTQSFNLASDARSIEVEVRANVQYSVSVSDNWIKQTGTKGLTTNKLTFSVDENSTYDARSATITIKPQNATVQEQVISVKQAQKDALIVKDTSFDMPYGGGEIEVKVEANVSFDVKPNVDWIHYVETKALSSSTVRLTVDENEAFASREGKVEIKQVNGTLLHTVSIKQSYSSVLIVSDLGLSVKWATFNLGASKPEEYGDYYAWGETSTKNDYNWSSYKWCNGSAQTITKYNTDGGNGSIDNKTVLDLEDDIAYVERGEYWRLPTKAEWTELMDNCTWIWASKNGVNGYNVISKLNGNSIFLPAGGYRFNSADYEIGSVVRYYSSSLVNGYSACCWALDGTSSNIKIGLGSRYVGASIRPVYGDKSVAVIEVTGVSLNKSSLSLVMGESVTLTATVSPENATYKTVTWSSSNTIVASVDQNGKITAVNVGTAIITARAGEKTATCIVTVSSNEIVVEEITLNKTSLSLKVGDSETLVATVKPNNATDIITWRTSDTSVASVDDSGKVTAQKVGVATITALVGELSATCNVTVQSESRNVPEGAVDLGMSILWATKNLGAPAPEDFGNRYAWGEVNAKDDYSVTNYVFLDWNNYRYYNNVQFLKYNKLDGKKILDRIDDAASVNLGGRWRMPTEKELSELFSACHWERGSTGRVGEEYLKGTSYKTGETIIIPAQETGGTGKPYTIKLMSSEGNINNVSTHEHFVNNVSSEGDSGDIYEKRYEGFYIRPVYDPSQDDFVPVSSISLDKTELTLEKGETASLIATVMPANVTDKTILWSSPDWKYATVDQSGKVTAWEKGTVTIYAYASGKVATCKVTVVAN